MLAHSYTPSDARATRTLCCDDVNAERAPLVRGVHEGLWIMLGVQVAHFRPMCLTARNSLRRLTSPICLKWGLLSSDLVAYCASLVAYFPLARALSRRSHEGPPGSCCGGRAACCNGGFQ